MKLDFKNFEFVGTNCPYFTGVKDHGQKLTLDFTADARDALHLHCEGPASLHIHQDGTMYTTIMEYNNGAEEWEETVVEDYTKDNKFRTLVDSWLKQNNLYRSTQFPYTISKEHYFFGEDFVCDSLDSLLDYLKKHK